MYQNRLALELKRIGYEIEYGKDLAVEIKGYSKEYIEAESQRNRLIQQEKVRRNQFGRRADQLIVRDTRERKQNLSPEQIREAHRAKAADFGNQPERVIAASRERRGVEYSAKYRAEFAIEAIHFAKDKLSERTTVMVDQEIHKEALRYGRGHIGLEDVERAFEACQSEFREVTHWRQHSPGRKWTTPELIAKETAILEFMKQGRNALLPMAGEISKEEFRERFKPLTDSQKHFVWDIIHCSDQMIGVQGLAGTGKTRSLGVLRAFAEDYGYEVRGMAATSKAVEEMVDAGVEARTVQSFVSAAAKGKGIAKKPTAYFVDEATLCDVELCSSMLKYVRNGDRVFVIGDVRQQFSLGAGVVFAELQEAGMSTFRLWKIERQQTPEYLAIVKELAAGRISDALHMMERQGRIKVYEDRDERYRAIAQEVLHSPMKTLVVSPDNRSRVDIGMAIRSAKQEAGQVGPDVYRNRSLVSRDMTKVEVEFAAGYDVGNVILFSRENKTLGVRSGEYAQVVSVDRDKNKLRVLSERDGRVFEYNPSKAAAGVTVFEAIERPLAQGDRIQFTKKWSEYQHGKRGKPGKAIVHAVNRQMGDD